MADLTKINEVITELEGQVDSMKQFGNVIAKINALSEETISLSQRMGENAKYFEELGNKLSSIINDNDRSFQNMQLSFTEKIDTNHKLVLDYNKQQAESLQKYIQQIDSTVTEFKRNAGNKIDEMRSDNKSFHRDIEMSLESRLETLKIAIQSSLRTELEHNMKNIEIQFAQSITTVSKELSDSKEQISNEQKKNRNLLSIVLILNIVMIIGMIYSITK